jgi:hypothetical protein
MTTPDPSPDMPKVIRAEPTRRGSMRSGGLPGGQPAPSLQDVVRAVVAAAADAPTGPTPGISESVTQAVRTGYQVVADNVRQGREAAQKFGKGDYNSSNVDEDVKKLTDRMLDLARELTFTTLDVIERLVQETRSATVGLQAARVAATVAKSAAEASKSAAASALKVTFSGDGKAVDLSSTLFRLGDLSTAWADPLTSGAGYSLSAVFTHKSADAAVANINIPADQAPGRYTGLVFASGAVGAIGYISIDVTEVVP